MASPSPDPPRRPPLKSKFRIGSARSNRLSYRLGEKVFHVSDTPASALTKKKEVLKTIAGDRLAVHPPPWQPSTHTREPRNVLPRLKENPAKEGLDRMPLPKGIKLWDGPERKAEGMDTWKGSTVIEQRERKQWTAAFEDKVAKHRGTPTRYLRGDYITPFSKTEAMTFEGRERKVAQRGARELLIEQLKKELPGHSENKYQAEAFRIMRDLECQARQQTYFPVAAETFRPNLSLTLPYRKYKEYFHPGRYKPAPALTKEREDRLANRANEIESDTDSLMNDEQDQLHDQDTSLPSSGDEKKQQPAAAGGGLADTETMLDGALGEREGEGEGEREGGVMVLKGGGREKKVWSCCLQPKSTSKGCEYRLIDPDAWSLGGF
ncbi:unnamed protein product [Vitrella brassicaformis CCMP3155]|uniref:Uncharacterized protein n=1 Tax=Vitrella brassicaformis (strain CCMP3155) TaxID=1169540 RepID=A0A0G4EFT3_VITBC|nr:unnamed protein product [Vitrella brassicaformis CCMP3155]|eukprot:CEL94245.1 unnamed protein product [Vitrella brassicaformis CCMP3155]